ncbi:DNA-binding protein [Streptomyces sp. NPDC048606]|uniref:DNA-binding protein n=1 Tax=Streptomyces sp. NPDC048606 TaxID=3154726 RepID=UPI003443F366
MSTDNTTDGIGNTTGEALLAAGAVLPVDAADGGPSAVPLTARAYRHPALGDERVVVRLAAAELGAAEDLAAGFLGLVPHGEPAVVGLGRRSALGFPEWVLVHHPEDGHQALALVPELDRVSRQVKTKPKAALDACNELAERLAASVPHFLPVFHEQAARVFLGVENTTYAAQLFGKARASETRFGLDIDEDRLDAVFLEFALAGALPVKVLTGYGKELSRRVTPAEALERFRRLCVRRTAGGLAPSAQATVELRRLARAAKVDAARAEQDYLAELLPLPATPRAATGWWTAHRASLVALARREPSVRGTLLGMIPQGSGGAGELAPFWLELLEESGAVAGLVDVDAPEGEASPDGTAGWLERFHASRFSGWRRAGHALAGLRPLVVRCAQRLRAELALPGREEGLKLNLQDVSLVDLLLSLDVPVAVTDAMANGTMELERWRADPERRDLAALCADERLRPTFFRTLRGGDRSAQNVGRETFRLLAGSPGSADLLAEWVRLVAGETLDAGLPELPAAINRLSWLPDEALALAPKEVSLAAGLDLGSVLAHTLRGGMFEELVWPAWEEAVSEMSPRRGDHRLTVMDAWPHVIVANSSQVRVIGPDSTVLTHDLRVPSGGHRQVGFHHTDDDLLVFWATYEGEVRGYWLSAPDEVLTLESSATYWSVRTGHVTLPLPGGGRTTGHGVLHGGDSRVPAERPILSDGVTHWVWERGAEGEETGWYEYEPTGGSLGRRSLPGFLADALRDHPAGSTLADGVGQSWLRPAPTVEGSVLGAPVDGLLGWRTVRLPDGRWHGRDQSGRSVTTAEGATAPRHAVALPGDDRLRAVSTDGRSLVMTDPEGVVSARLGLSQRSTAAGYSAEGAELPPLAYWYCLRARDPRGSAVLRAMDSVRAGALLKAAAAQEKAERVPEAVAEALPEIGEGALLRGVVDRVRTALRQRKELARVAAALEPRPVVAPQPRPERGPTDRDIDAGLSGLFTSRRHGYSAESDATFRYLRLLATAVADTAAEAVPGRLHVDVPHATFSAFPWTEVFLERPAAVAYRAVVTGVTDEQRAALCRTLAEVDALGLASGESASGRWRRMRLRVEGELLRGVDGRERGHGSRHRTALPLGDGAVLAVTDFFEGTAGGRDFNALLHDPSGRFEVPAPYTGRVLPGPTAVPGDPERGANWLGAFLKEAAERGPAPWFPEAAAEFTRLTGVNATLARVVVAGLPQLDTYDRGFLTAELRATLGIKATPAGHAREELNSLSADVRRELVAALLPADPALLWTRGPDVAAAALVWNERVGRRTPVPEELLADAAKEVRVPWPPHRALPDLLGPDLSPVLSRDVDHPLARNGAGDEPTGPRFGTQTLTSAVALTAWLAHRLPAGDPLRACLPPALTAVRRRLAHPGLMLGVGHWVHADKFREAAGTPTETGEGYERYGAVVLHPRGGYADTSVLPARLDSTGSDPYLPLLRGTDQTPSGPETALRLAHDPAFAALLADPGVPAAGEAAADGTWWPQDPGRSVPDLVAEASAAYGLGADAACLYLALLAMPDPTDRNTARWTGWKPARLKAARAELAATELVVEAARPRAGRSLFLPGAWAEPQAPALPVETWKLPMYAMAPGGAAVLGALVPTLPAADLYRRAWARVVEGDVPRFEALDVKRAPARRRR